MRQASFFLKNTLLNLIGQILPLLVGVFCIPLLIEKLGNERFGLLSIIWVLIGYASFLDLGLGRTLTHLVSKYEGNKNIKELRQLIWTGLILIIIFSFIGSSFFVILAPKIADLIIKDSGNSVIMDEVISSLYWIGLCIPIVIQTSALKGLLEGKFRFDLINYIRIPLGIYMFIAPLVVSLFTNSLSTIVFWLLIGRIVSMLIYLVFCLKIYNNVFKKIQFDKHKIKQLISFGGWLTISNIVGPLMLYLDRFIITTLLSISVIAYYTTPYEIVTKIFLISSSLSAILFPSFSSLKDKENIKKLYKKSLESLYWVLTPVILLVILLSKQGLSLWINSDFAAESFVVAKILSMGVLIFALESIPFTLIQSLGRPDIPAKLNLIELPFYLLLLWFLTKRYGVEGAALSWLIRGMIDFILLLYFSNKAINYKHVLPNLFVIISLILLFLNMFTESITIKIISFLIVIGLSISKTKDLYFKKGEKDYGETVG